MIEQINKVKLLAIRESKYTMYVFQNLDFEGYIMCTRLPNWKVPDLNVGDIGFLEYQIIKAGEEYFNVATQQKQIYQYSNIYFNNFILENAIIKNKEIIL